MVANFDLVNEILKSKNLNITEIRRQVISLLMRQGVALTQKELEETLEVELGQVNRVTLYRTIRVLLEKKAIHQVAIDSQTVKYKLAGENQVLNHPHFNCFCCNSLVCMPQLKIEQELIPDGFVMQSSNIVIEGVCPDCNRVK